MQYPELYLYGCKERIIRLCKDIVHHSNYDDDKDFYNLISNHTSEMIFILADLIKMGLIKEEKT